MFDDFDDVCISLSLMARMSLGARWPSRLDTTPPAAGRRQHSGGAVVPCHRLQKPNRQALTATRATLVP